MLELVNIDFLDIEYNENYEKIINNVVYKCYQEENMLSSNLSINIMLTNPTNIREINNKYRNIDKETDVLSFPIFEKEELVDIINCKNKYKDILGDIVVSIEKVTEQAKEYEHSFERELSYMIVHGFYHLLGYDHMVEEDKKIMREKEENILNKLDLKR